MSTAAVPRALAREWQVWLAENRLQGVPAEPLVERLKEEGVPETLVLREIRLADASPVLAAAGRVARRERQLALVAKLHAEVLTRAAHPADVPRIPTPSEEDFVDRYVATNTPVVLTDFTRAWPALERWTPLYLKDHYGSLEVEIADGRDTDPDPDMNFQLHLGKTTLGDYVDRILAAGETNDFYMIANNKNLERTELKALFREVVFPGYLKPDWAPTGSALWLGPAGTVTPLHHDTSSILFCQFYGRKRVKLVSPFETSLLESARGVYSAIDCESPDLERFPEFAGATVKTLELGPGDTLFIPVGWWHHVRALEVSISLALNNFGFPNVYEWYKPGGP